MQVSRKWTVLPFLNSKMRLMGEGEKKWEEMRSELQWDLGPCGVLCTRIRTWDFAVATIGSTAGCCGGAMTATWTFLNLLAKPSSVRPQGLYPGCACCQACPPSLSTISYSPKRSLSGKLVLTLPNRLDSPAEQSNHPILPFCGTYQNCIT